jgi:hypothetical protein
MYISDGEAQVLSTGIGKLGPLLGASSKRLPVAEVVRWTLPGFLGTVRVLTSFGLLPVEALRVNDPVRTTTGRNLPVRRINRIGLDLNILYRHPDAQPIQVTANALGEGLPARDMLVSPAQELNVAINDQPPRPITARDITGIGSIVRSCQASMIYYSFELSESAIVYAEGVPVLISAYPAAWRDEDDVED